MTDEQRQQLKELLEIEKKEKAAADKKESDHLRRLCIKKFGCSIKKLERAKKLMDILDENVKDGKTITDLDAFKNYCQQYSDALSRFHINKKGEDPGTGKSQSQLDLTTRFM